MYYNHISQVKYYLWTIVIIVDVIDNNMSIITISNGYYCRWRRTVFITPCYDTESVRGFQLIVTAIYNHQIADIDNCLIEVFFIIFQEEPHKIIGHNICVHVVILFKSLKVIDLSYSQLEPFAFSTRRVIAFPHTDSHLPLVVCLEFLPLRNKPSSE